MKKIPNFQITKFADEVSPQKVGDKIDSWSCGLVVIRGEFNMKYSTIKQKIVEGEYMTLIPFEETNNILTIAGNEYPFSYGDGILQIPLINKSEILCINYVSTAIKPKNKSEWYEIDRVILLKDNNPIDISLNKNDLMIIPRGKVEIDNDVLNRSLKKKYVIESNKTLTATKVSDDKAIIVVLR